MSDRAPAIRCWDGPPPTEDAIRRLYAAERLQPDAWANGPHDAYPVHEHAYEKVLRVIRGSIRFDLPRRDEAIDLGPGDTLVLPAGVAHSAVVGPEGVTCLEAQRPAQ
jgi:mannose-6-phosphate isomerase-like protein (cupin superfamily)